MQRQVLTRTVGHGETGFLLRSIASSKVFSANKMADITEGVRVQIDNGSVLICVGRDDQNFYFQDENGNKIVYSTWKNACNFSSVISHVFVLVRTWFDVAMI